MSRFAYCAILLPDVIDFAMGHIAYNLISVAITLFTLHFHQREYSLYKWTGHGIPYNRTFRKITADFAEIWFSICTANCLSLYGLVHLPRTSKCSGSRTINLLCIREWSLPQYSVQYVLMNTTFTSPFIEYRYFHAVIIPQFSLPWPSSQSELPCRILDSQGTGFSACFISRYTTQALAYMLDHLSLRIHLLFWTTTYCICWEQHLSSHENQEHNSQNHIFWYHKTNGLSFWYDQSIRSTKTDAKFDSCRSSSIASCNKTLLESGGNNGIHVCFESHNKHCNQKEWWKHCPNELNGYLEVSVLSASDFFCTELRKNHRPHQNDEKQCIPSNEIERVICLFR